MRMTTAAARPRRRARRGEGERLREEILVAARELLAETQDADEWWRTIVAAARRGVTEGAVDGSDVAEVMLTLLVIERAGAQAICAAPDANQAGVVDHRVDPR